MTGMKKAWRLRVRPFYVNDGVSVMQYLRQELLRPL
ncbi:MAG: hypothetical protein JWN23_225 [Rhodocyclales bacterium]|nr:hypothetical protein [Rhodocyclales bacterium]